MRLIPSSLFCPVAHLRVLTSLLWRSLYRSLDRCVDLVEYAQVRPERLYRSPISWFLSRLGGDLLRYWCFVETGPCFSVWRAAPSPTKRKLPSGRAFTSPSPARFRNESLRNEAYVHLDLTLRRPVYLFQFASISQFFQHLHRWRLDSFPFLILPHYYYEITLPSISIDRGVGGCRMVHGNNVPP